MVAALVSAGAAAQDGQAYRLGLRLCDLAVPGAGAVPSGPDGVMVRGSALRHLPASRLDHGVLDPLRQSLLQPVPLSLDCVPVWLGPAVRDARRDDPCRDPLRRRPRAGADL